MMKRTAANIREDIFQVTQQMMEGDENAGFPILKEEGEEKVVACMSVITKLLSEIIEGEVYLKRAQAFINARKNAVERLEREVVLTMEAIEKKKLDRPDCKVSVVAPKPVVWIDDESLIPEEFINVKEERKPDKMALKEVMEAGLSIEGCRIVDGKTGLRYSKPKDDGAEDDFDKTGRWI